MPRIVQVQYQCDGNSKECEKTPSFITSEGKAYCMPCLTCILLSMVSLKSGQISLTYTTGESTQVMEEVERARTADISRCPECGAGPLRNVQIHRRKRHGIYVRGPKAAAGTQETGIGSMFDREA